MINSTTQPATTPTTTPDSSLINAVNTTSAIETGSKIVGAVQFCIAGFMALNVLMNSWQRDKIYEIEKKYRDIFLSMKHAFEQRIHRTVSPFFDTKDENGKLMLTMKLSRVETIARHNLSLDADPVLYSLYDSVVVGFVESLKLQEGSGLFAALIRANDHHPFVIFACEFINWANEKLLDYQMDDKNTITQLSNRVEYLRDCHSIEGLIPRAPNTTAQPTITRFMAKIINSMDTTIKQLIELQKYNAFKQSIEGISQGMLKVLLASISAQYYMIDCLPIDTGNSRFSPSEITRNLPSGYNPLTKLEPARQTMIFKHIHLFLSMINCPGDELVWAAPPTNISHTFSLAMMALTIENTDQYNQYKISSGFNEKILSGSQKQTGLLTHQKDYLIELAKWLQSAKLLSQFLKLHNFRGAEWSFCGRRGGRLLAKQLFFCKFDFVSCGSV